MSLAVQIQPLADQGASANEIAEALQLSTEAVEYELARAGKVREEDIPEEDFLVIRNRLLSIAKESDDEHLAAKVGIFLYEQKRGTAKMKQAPAINISQINQLILASHERLKQVYRENLSRPGSASENPGEGSQFETATVATPEPGPDSGTGPHTR